MPTASNKTGFAALSEADGTSAENTETRESTVGTEDRDAAAAETVSPVAQHDPVDTTTATETDAEVRDPIAKDDAETRVISTAGNPALPVGEPDVVQSPASHEGVKLGQIVFMVDFINNNFIEFPATVTGIHLNDRVDLHATPPGQAPRNMNGVKHFDAEGRHHAEEGWSAEPRLASMVEKPYVARAADRRTVASTDAADPSYEGIQGTRPL